MSGRVARIARRVAAVSGVVVLLALAVWGLERGGAFNAWLTTRIAALLGPQVRFSAARAVWWPHLEVILDQVALVPAEPAPAGGSAAATAVTCRVRLAPLLRGGVEIGAVEVDGLHLALQRAPDGALRAGGLEAFAVPAAGSPDRRVPTLPVVQVRSGEVEYRDATRAPARTVELRAVDLQVSPSGGGARAELTASVENGGTLRVRGALDSLSDVAAAPYRADVEADGLDAAAVLPWLPAAPDQTTAQGRLRLTATLSGRGTADAAGDVSIELADGSLAWVGWQAAAPLHATTHAAWDGSALTLSQGHIDVARVSGAALSADTLEASFAYADGALRVDAAQLRACGGTWRPAGSATVSDPPHIEASLQAEGVDGAQLAESLRGFGISAALPQLTAPLRLSAQASGEPGGRWNGHANIATDGALTWSSARLEGPLEIASDVKVDGAAVELANGRAQARRIALGQLSLTGVDSSFSYARGVARVAPLRAATFGGAWTYTGSLPLDTATAWSGQLIGTQINAAALRDAFAGGSAAAAVDGKIDLKAQLTGTGSRAVGGTATVRLASPALAWDDLRVDSPATVSAALRLQDTRLTFSNGQAQAQRIRLRELDASTISAGFGYTDDTLHLTAIQAYAIGGRWHASGAVRLAAPPSWSATVDAKHVDFAALLHAADPDRDGPRSIGGIADLKLTMSPEDAGEQRGSVSLTLSHGEFIWDDLHVTAPAHASGTVIVHGDTFSLSQVAAEAARAAYGPLVATAATAHLHYGGERLSFDDLRFTSCGGSWTHSGWFTLDEGGQFAGQTSIEGADPDDLVKMLGMAGDVPFARVDLDSEFAGHATPDWQSTLRASGTIYLDDGTIPTSTVLRPIWEALIGPGRVMNAIDRRTTHVSEVSDSFTLRQGRLYTTDLSMDSTDYSVTAVGSIGLDGSLDLNARIQLTARGVQNMLVFASLPLPTISLPSLPPIPARVTGQFGSPVIRPNVSALPASTVRWMVAVLLHVPRTLGGAVLDGLGHLWDRVTGRPATGE